MKPEDIKIDETYNVRVKIRKIGETYIECSPILEGGVLSHHWPTAFAVGETSAFSPITTENGRNNSEPAPKYDPNRLFQKGDRVRVVEYKGRIKPYLKDVLGKVYTLDEGENNIHIAYIKADGIDLLDVCHLELVSPVEELDPYEVTESTDYFAVAHRRTGDEPATFWKESHPNPAAAAEAECARLNAEHRKEKTNA